jgi:hypothetical protein
VAIAHGRAVTELGFARSGPGWWFADWMVVMTAAQVAAVLHKELAAHGSKVRGKNERLVRFDRSHSKPYGVPEWRLPLWSIGASSGLRLNTAGAPGGRS